MRMKFEDLERVGKEKCNQNILYKTYFNFYSFHVKRTRDTVQW